MAASSPVTISHGMVNRRRTGSARRTAIDPANAAFIGSGLLLAVAMSIGRYYRLLDWVARSGVAPRQRPALGCLIKPARRVFRLRRRCRSTTGQRRAGPGRSIGRVPDAPGSVAARCAGSRLGGSKFPEHDDLLAGAWTFLAPKTSASSE